LSELFDRFLSNIKYELTAGEKYQWECWKNARYYESVGDGYSVEMVADSIRKTVYQITMADTTKDVTYRWLNPDHIGAYLSECKERRINPDETDDEGGRYSDTESADDILTKIKCIVNNLPYDKTVVLQICLPHLLIVEIALAAHEQNITLNQFVAQALKSMIDSSKD
jgi:hypothetical protein